MASLLPLPYLLVAYCCFLASLAMPAQVMNITLDDTDPAIRYLPLGAWGANVAPNHCCRFPYNRTWHEASCGHGDPGAELTIEFNFTGTAIYLYSLQSRRSSLPSSQVSLSLDGQQAISSNLDATTVPDRDVISLCNLSNTHHNIVLSVGTGSSFLFDYLIYPTTIASDIKSSFVLQARQDINSTASNNATQTSTSALDAPSVSGGGDSLSGKSNAGAIAGAIASSIGITSLFLVGLAISIIKIRGQRARVRRERRTERDRQRSRGLEMYLPSPASPRFPRRTGEAAVVVVNGDEPPSYDTAMGLMARGTSPQNRLAPIEEAPATARSSVLACDDEGSPAEGPCSLDGMHPPPPGLHAASSGHLNEAAQPP